MILIAGKKSAPRAFVKREKGRLGASEEFAFGQSLSLNLGEFCAKKVKKSLKRIYSKRASSKALGRSRGGERTGERNESHY